MKRNILQEKYESNILVKESKQVIAAVKNKPLLDTTRIQNIEKKKRAMAAFIYQQNLEDSNIATDIIYYDNVVIYSIPDGYKMLAIKGNAEYTMTDEGDIVDTLGTFDRQGMFHSFNDEPSTQDSVLYSWHKHGNLHRETGPAVVFKDGTGSMYWLDGIKYDNEKQFKQELARRDLLKKKSQESGLDLTFESTNKVLLDTTSMKYADEKRNAISMFQSRFKGGSDIMLVLDEYFYGNIIVHSIPEGYKVFTIPNNNYFRKPPGKESISEVHTFNKNGESHSFNDEPAVVENSILCWYKNGVPHRETGHAVERPHEKIKEYWLDGVYYKTEEEFKKELERMSLLKTKSQESGLDLTFESYDVNEFETTPGGKKVLDTSNITSMSIKKSLVDSFVQKYFNGNEQPDIIQILRYIGEFVIIKKFSVGYEMVAVTPWKTRRFVRRFDNEGMYHSWNDKPSVENDVVKVWDFHGTRHREIGPTVIHKDGAFPPEYYLDGTPIPKVDFEKELARRNVLKKGSKDSGLDLTFENIGARHEISDSVVRKIYVDMVCNYAIKQGVADPYTFSSFDRIAQLVVGHVFRTTPANLYIDPWAKYLEVLRSEYRKNVVPFGPVAVIKVCYGTEEQKLTDQEFEKWKVLNVKSSESGIDLTFESTEEEIEGEEVLDTTIYQLPVQRKRAIENFIEKRFYYSCQLVDKIYYSSNNLLKVFEYPEGYEFIFYNYTDMSVSERHCFDKDGDLQSMHGKPASVNKFEEIWIDKGKLHRIGGPAQTLFRYYYTQDKPNKTERYYIRGKEYTKKEYYEELERMGVLKKKSEESGLDLTFESASGENVILDTSHTSIYEAQKRIIDFLDHFHGESNDIFDLLDYYGTKLKIKVIATSFGYKMLIFRIYNVEVYWFDLNGMYHSFNDEPALVTDTETAWYNHGKLHRIGGPAHKSKSLSFNKPVDYYYLDGVNYKTKQDYERELARRNILDKGSEDSGLNLTFENSNILNYISNRKGIPNRRQFINYIITEAKKENTPIDTWYNTKLIDHKLNISDNVISVEEHLLQTLINKWLNKKK